MVGAVSLIVTVDQSSVAEAIKRADALDRGFKRCDRAGDLLDAPCNLWSRHRDERLAKPVAIWSIRGDEVIVVEVDLAQNAVATGAGNHPVIHPGALKPTDRRRPFGADSIPRITGEDVIVKDVYDAVRVHVVSAECHSRVRVGGAGLSPADECV